MTDTDADLRARNRDSWSRYWAMHPAHSLPGTFDAGYGDAIARFWQDTSTALPQDAAVLDVATGNGPLPRLLLGWRSDLRIDAIDAAQVAPDWAPPASAMPPRFHGGIHCEALPFADAGFDLVSSQYGIEYSDLPRSLAEVARVLRPGGRFAAVMHDTDSRITHVTRDELGHVQLLLADAGALDCVEAMAPLLSIAATEQGRARLNADPSAGAVRARFNASMQHVQQAAATALAPDLLAEFLEWTPQVLSVAGNPPDATEALRLCAQYRQQLEDAQERYRALLAAALSPQGQTDFIERLRDLGFTTSGFTPLSQEGHRLGIAISATRVP